MTLPQHAQLMKPFLKPPQTPMCVDAIKQRLNRVSVTNVNQGVNCARVVMDHIG